MIELEERTHVVLTADHYILGPYTMRVAKMIAGKEGDLAVVKRLRSRKEVERIRQE